MKIRSAIKEANDCALKIPKNVIGDFTNLDFKEVCNVYPVNLQIGFNSISYYFFLSFFEKCAIEGLFLDLFFSKETFSFVT